MNKFVSNRLTKSILKWLQGKKTLFISISALAVTYALAEQRINENLAYFLNSLLVVIGGGTSYLTGKMYDVDTPKQRLKH